MDPDQDDTNPPAPGCGRRGRRRALPHRIIRNRYLTGMPKSRNVNGVEVIYDEYDDEDDHEDEEIDQSLLL
ncbi:hypothetical protein A2U01_0076169, partial [Trifolium medium]|nr:hypothetical protein [Trifolium medium]